MVYRTVRPGNQARWFVAVLVSVCWLAAGAGAALATPAAGSASAPELRAPVAAARLTLPAPTGPWPIGVRSGFVADPTRIDPATGKPRTLPIRVWYPARHAAARGPAPYFSAAVQRVVEGAFNLPSGMFDVDTHAAADAPMHRHIKGVILVSGGLGEPVALQTGHVIELASRGWVLVTFDHPHDTFVVEQPDGTLIFGDPDPSPQAIEAAFEQRVLDVGVVLRQLATLLPRRAHSLPVAMFGFSIGGSTAAEALLRYPRLRAAVDLDGRAVGRVVQEGLDEPLGIMVDRQGLDQVPLLALLVSHLRGPHPIQQLDVEHHGFTDFVVFNPEATLADPALGAWLEATYATGIDTFDAGAAALSAERRFLTNFMDRYLTDCHHYDHARALRNAPASDSSASWNRALRPTSDANRRADMQGLASDEQRRAPECRRRPPFPRRSARSSSSSPAFSVERGAATAQRPYPTWMSSEPRAQVVSDRPCRPDKSPSPHSGKPGRRGHLRDTCGARGQASQSPDPCAPRTARTPAISRFAWEATLDRRGSACPGGQFAPF